MTQNSPQGSRPASENRSFDEMEASLEKAGRVEELVRLYETRAREVPAAEEAGHLLTRAGELARDRLRNFQRAEELFRRALSFLPGGREPLEGLRLLYEARNDFSGLADVLERLAATSTGTEAAMRYLQAADLFEQRLSRIDRAVICCQMASRAEPRERQAFQRARRLFLADGRFVPAYESLERERAALGDHGMAEEYLGFAERLADDPAEGELAQRAIAVAQKIDPGNLRAEKVQKALTRLPETWKDRVRQLRGASLEERDRKAAARLSLHVAKLFSWFEPTATAKVKEAIDRCFLLWPAMPDALTHLERVAQKGGDVNAAVQVFEKLARDAKDKSVQCDLYLRIGTLRLTQKQDPAGALAAFEQAVKADPSRADAASLAGELLIEANRATDAVALLEKHLATLKDPHARVGLHLRLADLCQRLLKDEASARKHLEAAIKLDPSNAQAAFRLARVLADAGDLAHLWPYVELAVTAPRPVPERVAFCENVAMLYEESEPKKSCEALAMALFIDPTHAGVLASLLEVARAAKSEPQAALAIRRAALVARGESGVRLWRTLAQLYEALARAVDAETAWNEVLKRLPGDPAATAALAALARRRSEAAADPRTRLEQEARRLEASAADPAAAAAIYRKILELEPDDAATLRKLGAANAAMAKWDEVAIVAERLMALADTLPERQEWRARLAQLYAERLNRREEAARLFLNLLTEGAATAGVVGGLERLASQGVRQAEISRALAPHYARTGDYQRQVASLLVQLSTVQGKDEQKGLLALLSDTSEKHLMDSQAAFGFRLRGLSVDPADSTFRAEVARLGRQLGAHAEAARYLAGLGSQVPDAALATSLLVEAAQLAAEGGAVDDAANALNLALEKCPDDPGILMRLVRLYASAKRLAECDAALRRRIMVAEPEEKAGLFLQLAEVNSELGRPREAAQAVTEAIKVGANEDEQLPRLARFLEAGGRASELTVVLGRMAELAEKSGDKEQASRLSLRRAQIVDAALGDKAEAVRRYAEILSRRPTDPDALSALEQMLQEPSVREEAARALAPAYEAVKEHRKLVAALQVVVEATQDSFEKVQALQRAAAVHLQHLRQPDQAFAALATALKLAPGDVGVRTAARKAAEEADAIDSYAAVLEDVLEGDAGAAAVALHQEVAEVQERRLGDRGKAIGHWRQVLQREPKHAEALKALARLHRANEEWQPLADVLEALAALEPDAAQKVALWREEALLREQKLSDQDGAAQCWRNVAARDALDKEAAGNLDRLYTELQRPRELAFALELRRNQEGQSPQGRELAFRLALVRRDLLSDPAGALQILRQILSEDVTHAGARDALEAWVRSDAPDSGAAMEILDPVLAQSGDHARRIALREARIANTKGQERTQLAAQIRSIFERDLGQPQAAFMAALKAFTDGLDREAVQPELERLARETESFEDLAEIYESTAEELPAGDEQVPALLRRAAELREQLGQVDDAVRVWKALLAQAPQDRQALDSLSRLFEKTKNAKNLSEVYARQAQLANDPAERLSLLFKAGTAFEEAGDDARAVEAFKSALAIRKDEEGLAALDRLYGRLHRFGEQADVLDQLAAGARQVEVRKGYVLRRAQLLEKEGGAVDAVRCYGQVLDLVPDEPQGVAGLERLLANEQVRPEAARLLEPTYRSANDAKKLVEVLDVRLGAADASVRLSLLHEIAMLREMLGQKSMAFAARVRHFAENPDDAASREELERLAADTGAFEELAATYEDQLERGVNPGLQGELWRRLAVVYSDRLNRPDLAARAWTEVFARDPKNLFVLDALARIYRKTSQFKELAGVMARQIALESNVTAQVNLLFELANLAEETLTDKALAARCYHEILERKADDPNAIKFLGRVLLETERYPELAQLVGREIQLAEAAGRTEEAYELMVRLGRLKVARLNDARGALTLFQEILRRRPNHPGAVGALEEMARSENNLRGEAAAALEPIFATEGDNLKLVQMLESRASSEPSAQERASLLRKIAEIYSQKLDNPEMGFVYATRALREVPDDERSLELCLFLVDAADAADELSTLLQEVANRAADDKARGALFRALARLQMEHQQVDAAVESWKRVLEVVPSDAEALDAIGRLLGKQNKVPELLEVLRRQLAAAEEPNRRANLLFQIGALQDEYMKDAAGALATFRRLLEIRPDDPLALERMDQLCEEQQRWPELADVLMRRLTLAGSDPSIELKFRLAQVRETRLMDKFGALDLYTEILAAQPGHPGAVGRLEALVAREPQNQTAADVLLRAYRASRDELKLAQLLEARAGVSQDGLERKALLLELADIRQRQEEPELSYLALYRAFKEDPNDADLRQRMEATAEAAKTFDELAAAYEEELPRIAEAKDAAEICLKLGFVLDQRLNEADRAAEFYERARQLDPAAAGRALPALDRLYNLLDKPTELAAVLEAEAEHSTEPQERIGLFFRLGQLAQERLDSPDRAAAAYEQLLEIDGKHLASARMLEKLYEAAGQNDKLLRVLQIQRDLVSGPEKERVLGRMALVSAESLSDVGHSIELYRELLSKNPRNEQAFAALEALLEKGRRYDDLRELIERKVAGTVDPRELVRLNDRLGRVVHRLMGQSEAAIPYFKAALERDARCRTALESLRDIFEELGRLDDFVTVLRRLIPLQEGAEGVKAIRIRLSEALAVMGRREEALDAARRALEVEPHNAVELNRVHDVFLNLKAYAEAVRTLELRAQTELNQEERESAVATLFQVADLWRGVANKPEAAGPVLERVLELDPANPKAYEQALTMYREANDWRALAGVMDRYLPHLVTEEEKLASLREMARVQEEKLGQKDVAFLQACRALQLAPADSSLQEEVERLAEETGSFEELAAVFEEVADGLARGPLAERLYLVLARVHDTKLDDPGAAEAELRKVLEFDPTNERALDALAAMFERRGRSKEFVVALEQKLEATSSIERRKEILREIAKVFDERLNQPREASAALLRALDLEPDLTTLADLTELYRREKDFGNVAGTLLRARDLSPTPEDRSRIQVEVAQVYERDIADDEAAVEAYRQALEFDPANREALDSLERLYTKLDRPADLLAVYERQLELATDYRERVKVLFKSASIWEDRFRNLANADACVEAVLQIDPQNMQAIKALERLRKAQERWDELIHVVDRHIQLLSSTEEQAELCVEMGDVFHQHLKQVDRAVNAYHQALELNPRCRPAMHALGTLYERSGNWPFALDMLDKEAQVAGATAEAVELYHRMGKINEDMLLDPGSAKRCYLEALRIDPGYLPCIRSLKGIYEIEKEWTQFEKMLAQEAQYTEEPEAKSRAMLEVARFAQEHKEDRDGAAQWFEEALRLVSDSLEAARPLADIYIAREDWEGGERMLDIVVLKMAEKAGGEPDPAFAKELCRQLYRLGYVCEKLAKKDKALRSYEKAYQLDATYLPALEGLGNLLVQAQRYEEALKVYQTILIHHRDDLTDLEVVEIYWQLGDTHLKLKKHDAAQNHFEKALGIDPGHESSLRSLTELADQAGKYERSAEYRQKLITVLDGDAKFEVCVELGKLAKERLSDAYMAIDAYLSAHRISADSLDVMDALYVLYRETKQGQKAAEMLEKMLEHPDLKADPVKAKRVWFALGEISRDELKEVDRAIGAFNSALDLDYRFIEAFSAIEALLGANKRWQQLEENYARMLHRLPKVEDTHAARMTLWKALGDLYQRVLKRPQEAMQAYQVVAMGLPDNSEIQEAFADLASKLEGNEEQAIAAYRRALPQTTNPGKVASALAEMQARRKDYDSAWLAAQVVGGLIGEIGKNEQEILTKLTPYAKKKEVASRTLTDRMWHSHLFHPKVRGPLAELLGILFEQAGQLYKEELTRYGINPKRHLIDIGSAQEYHVHHFRYVSKLLGMEHVAMFSPYLVGARDKMAKRTTEPPPEQNVAVEVLHTHPPAIKVGGKFFAESGQKETYYVLGRTLAMLRPELALAQRLSAERLEAVVQAAISLSIDRFRFTADPRAIDAERRGLERTLTEQARSALKRVTKEYVKVATPADLRNYLEGAELSAVRAGLFVAGEIEPVKKMVMSETGALFRVQPRSKIRDLMVFALGEDLHALRLSVNTHVEVAVRRA